MNGLTSAIQFLTVLRIKNESSQDTRKLGESSLYFPVVGALLGIGLIALDKILSLVLPPLLTNLILIFTLLIITGAMHIDGLADSCDALFSGKGKEEMLSIMREVHLGTFGILAIVAIILFKLALLSSIPHELRHFSLVLMALLSRYSMSLAITFFPYARSEGKAVVFFQEKSLKNFFFSTAITLIILMFSFRIMSLAILFFTIAFTFFASFWVKSKIGGLTGDTLGALSELNEALILLSIVVLSKVYL